VAYPDLIKVGWEADRDEADALQYFFMDLLIVEAFQSHSDTPYLLGLLKTSDQHFVENLT